MSRVSISSDSNSSSDENDSSNDELPDAILPKRKSNDVETQTKISYAFPVDVITKSGKFTGMGSIDLVETSQKVQTIHKLRKTKAELKQVLTQFEQDLETLMQNSEHEELVQVQPISTNSHEHRDVIETNKKEVPKSGREKKRKDDPKRESNKKVSAEEKLAKADLEQIHKYYKPAECMKHIGIEIHPTLCEAWFMRATVRLAAERGVRLTPADNICDGGLLVWTRTVPPRLASEPGQMTLSSSRQQSPHALYVVEGAQAAALGERRLLSHLAVIRQLSPGCRALLVLAENINVRSCGLTREQFNRMINDLKIELLVSLQMDVVVAESCSQLADLILHYTKAVAEAPYKKARRDIDEQAEFYMRGDNKNCVTVDKDGNGTSRLWEQMLAVLPQSSLEVARSLAAQYRTPRALMQGLRSSGGVAKIAELGVSRTNVPGAKPRRLGPEFARKLHTLFTAEDGNTVIE